MRDHPGQPTLCADARSAWERGLPARPAGAASAGKADETRDTTASRALPGTGTNLDYTNTSFHFSSVRRRSSGPFTFTGGKSSNHSNGRQALITRLCAL